jgi:hypothetical protein
MQSFPQTQQAAPTFSSYAQAQAPKPQNNMYGGLVNLSNLGGQQQPTQSSGFGTFQSQQAPKKDAFSGLLSSQW